MSIIKHTIFIYPFLLILYGCVAPNNTEYFIEATIEKSEGNAQELYKVLNYFADDDERFKAAEYIIANLAANIGVGGRFIDSLETNLQTLSHIRSTPIIEIGFKERWNSSYLHKLDTIEECKTIKADYIISNIDHAYTRWKNKPWNKGLSFDHFCDLLLPLKIGNEISSNWREVYCAKYEQQLDSIYNGDDPIEACKYLKEIIYNDRKHILLTELEYPHRSALNILNCSVGTCRDECDFMTYAMRACGIPVTTDFYLTSPDNFTSHFWTVLYDYKSDSYIPYNEVEPRRYEQKWDGRKKGKVYRTFWGRMSSLTTDLIQVGDMTFYDVTSNYFGKNEIKIPLKKHTNRNISIGVYYRPGWKSIGCGYVDDSIALFYNIEPGVIYCAIDDRNRPVSSPFIYEKDKSITLLEPNMNERHQVTLNRKWPLTIMLKHEWLSKNHIGGYITAYSSPGLCDTIYKFSDTLSSNYIPIVVTSRKLYSHIKYTAPYNTQPAISEIQVFTDNERNDTLDYHAIVDNSADQSGISYISDNNILTYYKAPEESKSISFYFIKPSKLKWIDFIPRNDDNYVWPGQEYELLYYDIDLRWKTIGRKVAENHYLMFDSVPSNALLLLRNHTKGKAEQVFVWRNNRQTFCIDL